MTDANRVLDRTAELATAFLASLPTRPVGRPVDLAALRAALGGPLPEGPTDPLAVVEALAAGADPGIDRERRAALLRVRGGWQLAGGAGRGLARQRLGPERRPVRPVAGRGRRGGGGGRLAGRAARAARRDQRRVRDRRHDGQLHGPRRGPSRRPRPDRLGRRAPGPPGRPAGHRHHPWRDPHHGLRLAPDARARARGDRVRRIAADDQGRMRPDALREVLATIDGPAIVCAQAGNVNTGAFDPFEEIVAIAHERGAWVHVDGAFGIWAAAVPSLQRRDARLRRAPTRGRPTPTSGSTCRTTRASSSSATRPRTTPR